MRSPTSSLQPAMFLQIEALLQNYYSEIVINQKGSLHVLLSHKLCLCLHSSYAHGVPFLEFLEGRAIPSSSVFHLLLYSPSFQHSVFLSTQPNLPPSQLCNYFLLPLQVVLALYNSIKVCHSSIGSSHGHAQVYPIGTHFFTYIIILQDYNIRKQRTFCLLLSAGQHAQCFTVHKV